MGFINASTFFLTLFTLGYVFKRFFSNVVANVLSVIIVILITVSMLVLLMLSHIDSPYDKLNAYDVFKIIIGILFTFSGLYLGRRTATYFKKKK